MSDINKVIFRKQRLNDTYFYEANLDFFSNQHLSLLLSFLKLIFLSCFFMKLMRAFNNISPAYQETSNTICKVKESRSSRSFRKTLIIAFERSKSL